jgi:hypothetical protein
MLEKEQQDEFYDIRSSVYESLRLGQFCANEGIPVCRLVTLPAFENPFSWDVRQKHVRKLNCSQTRLYRTEWRMDLDYEALESPVVRQKYARPFRPTMEVAWVPLNQAKVNAILARFQTIRVPLALKSDLFGCDGVTYELYLGGLFTESHLKWWVELPEEWKPLQPVVAELERLFAQTWLAEAKADNAEEERSERGASAP